MVVKLLQFEIILKGSPGKRGGGKWEEKEFYRYFYVQRQDLGGRWVQILSTKKKKGKSLNKLK